MHTMNQSGFWVFAILIGIILAEYVYLYNNPLPQTDLREFLAQQVAAEIHNAQRMEARQSAPE